MKAICSGWIVAGVRQHPDRTIIYHDDGVKDGKVTHGLCPECDRLVNEELDLKGSKQP